MFFQSIKLLPFRPFTQQAFRSKPKKNPSSLYFVAGCAALSASIFGFMGRPTEKDNDGSFSGFFRRFKGQFKDATDYFTEPVSDKLLPDPLPEQYQRPYTLVIGLNDILVHSVWDREKGWRHAKRPGVEYFLAYLSQFYEVVCFTNSHATNAQPILEQLDPFGYIMYRLYKESTRFIDGKVVKDLDCLNRDIKKVIIMDTEPEHFSGHPDNAIQIEKWNGKPTDTFLLQMIPFLETLALSTPEDVRTVVKSYHGKNIPQTFAENQEAYEKQLKEEHEKKMASHGFITRWLTGKTDRVVDFKEQRRRMHEHFLKEHAQFQKQAAEQYKKQLEEQERQMLEMSEKKMSVWDLLSQQQPQPSPQQQ